jgi:phospholipid/cholesterol/gamma-HCH transport system substrate-binding protein
VSPSLRDFLDPVASKNSARPTRTGAIVLIAGLLLIVLVVTNSVPFIDSQSGYTVKADFASFNGVNTRTPVRVDGVDVGVVTGIGAAPDALRSSQLNLLITNSSVVVHSNATASVRWRTVLGGTVYVDLNPGSPDAPRLTGSIPVSRTSDQVEFDDLTRIYNGSTAQNQRALLAGLSSTFAAPAQIDHSVGALPDLTTVGKGLAPYQGSNAGDLSELVAGVAHTVAKLGASTSSLQKLVAGANQTLGAIDAQSSALDQILELSPGTLNSTELTAHRLDITLAKLNPLVQHLEPAARLLASTSTALRPALDQTNDVLRNAQPLLHAATPTFSNLLVAAERGTPLLTALDAPVARLNSNILPWLAQRSSDTRLLNYESIGPFFSVLDEAAAEYDESGYRLHLSTLVGSASVEDESMVTAGKSALMATCRSAAKPRQRGDCAALSSTLADWLYGGGL